MKKFENLLLRNRWANFKQTWQKASRSDVDSSLSNEGPCPFLWGYKSHVAKEYRVNGPISNTPGTNNCSFSSNEGQFFYPSGDNSDIAKIHVRYIEDIKILFSRTRGPNLTKNKLFSVKEIQVCTIKDHSILKTIMIFFLSK